MNKTIFLWYIQHEYNRQCLSSFDFIILLRRYDCLLSLHATFYIIAEYKKNQHNIVNHNMYILLYINVHTLHVCVLFSRIYYTIQRINEVLVSRTIVYLQQVYILLQIFLSILGKCAVTFPILQFNLKGNGTFVWHTI